MASIRISINENIERILESLKGDYPTLDYPELFKLGLAELYRKRELEARQRWVESLPTLEISEDEAASIAEGRRELERGEAKAVTIEELLTELHSD
jgi:hypothetical protein